MMMLHSVLSLLLGATRRSACVTGGILALWACWIGLSLPAFADCVNGARDPTEQEKQTAVRVLTALREAFPVPPGWNVTNDTKIEAPRFFCKGDEVLRLWFQRTFTREQGMKERTAEYNRRLADAKRLTPEEQGQLADIDKEIGNLARQMSVPRSGLKQRDLDKDKRAQLESELKQLNDSMTSLRQRRQALATPWLADGPRKKQYEESIAEATREFRKDTEIVVKVAINGSFEPVKDGERFEVPSVPIAYRSAPRQEMPGTFTEGMTTLFFGQSRARPVGNPGSLEPLLDPTDPTKPRTFTVSIQADQDRAMQVIQGMNFESLNALTQ